MKTLLDAWNHNTLNKIAIIAAPLLIIIVCCCLPVASALLSPSATPRPSSTISPLSTITSIPVNTSSSQRPKLTPLPGQEKLFPTQTAQALLLTVQAGYSPTSIPPTSAPLTFTPVAPRVATSLPIPSKTRVVVLPSATSQAANCNPAYPTLCLTHEVNCPEIDVKNFPVLPPDPYGLDRDKDGIGCEE